VTLNRNGPRPEPGDVVGPPEFSGFYVKEGAGAAEAARSELRHGRHVIPHKMGGPITEENCVLLCRSCHRNAHQGGRWRDTAIYKDILELTVAGQIAKIAARYPHYQGWIHPFLLGPIRIDIAATAR
jgi:hypothetical protein